MLSDTFGDVAQTREEANSMSSALLDAANNYVDALGGGEGQFETSIDGVGIVRSFHRVDANHRLYRPSLCVVMQGTKQVVFGEETLAYGAMECLIVTVEIPACGRIVEASPGVPFVGIIIDLDMAVMLEVIKQLDTPPVPAANSGSSLFVARVEQPLADCLTRLIGLAAMPRAVPMLASSIIREMYYWLLTGPYGGELCRMALPDTRMDRIARAIRLLREHYAQTLRIEHLAEAARMSPSSFHQHFKAVTSMTPLQFQKQLRLLEARRLMVADAVNVTEAAYQVGYESLSQFSREYSRAFGVGPKRDAMTRKAELDDMMGAM